MRIGSLVTPIKTLVVPDYVKRFARVKELPVPGRVYTVRSMPTCKRTGSVIVLLEELIMAYNKHSGEEMGCPVHLLRELDLPHEELEREITESLKPVIREVVVGSCK